MITVQVTWADAADQTLGMPCYESKAAAGADVRANFPPADRGGICLAPGERGLVPTGLRLAIPEGYEVQLRPRSGLALKHGITLLNTPGTIDSDYRGEIKVILINLGQDAFTIQRGERIAQLVLAPVTQLAWIEVDALDETDRGAGGFGSTGR